MVGTECPPFDEEILKKMQQDHKFEPTYTLKCLEANSHNSAIATYFLLLKQHIRAGNFSVADTRLKSYDKTAF